MILRRLTKKIADRRGAALLVPVLVISSVANLAALWSMKSSWRLGYDSTRRMQREFAQDGADGALAMLSRLFNNGTFVLNTNSGNKWPIYVSGQPLPSGFTFSPAPEGAARLGKATYSVCDVSQLKTSEVASLYASGGTSYVTGANGTCAGRQINVTMHFMEVTSYPHRVRVRAVPQMKDWKYDVTASLSSNVTREAFINIGTPMTTCDLEAVSSPTFNYGQAFTFKIKIWGTPTSADVTRDFNNAFTPGGGTSVPGMPKSYIIDGNEYHEQTLSFYPEGSGTLTGTASGPAGSQDCAATLRFYVKPLCALQASPAAVTASNPISFAAWHAGPWTTRLAVLQVNDATPYSVTYDPIGGSPRVFSYTPTQSGTFSGRLVGFAGATTFCTAVPYQVSAVPPPPAPPTCTMWANPNPVNWGAQVTLGVNLGGGPTSTITIQGANAPGGSRTITAPNNDFVATASVTGPGGTRSCSMTVNTEEPPGICRFTTNNFKYKEPRTLCFTDPVWGPGCYGTWQVGLGMELFDSHYKNVPRELDPAKQATLCAAWAIPNECWAWQTNTLNDTRCFLLKTQNSCNDGKTVVVVKLYDMTKTSCDVSVPGVRNAQGVTPPGGCFSPDAEILISDGSTLRADAIRVGMSLWNPVLGRGQSVKEVIAGPEKPKLFVFQTKRGTLKVTEQHPMRTQRGLVQAIDVRISDVLEHSDGSPVPIVSIRREKLSESKKVWNFVLQEAGHNVSDEDHYVVANGIVTGDLYLQRKLEKPLP